MGYRGRSYQLQGRPKGCITAGSTADLRSELLNAFFQRNKFNWQLQDILEHSSSSSRLLMELGPSIGGQSEIQTAKVGRGRWG